MMKANRATALDSSALASRERIAVVFAGHVDHGKSSVVGRLLSDSGAMADEKIAAVRTFCEKNARPFEYAFLLDALSDERAQGVTIDTASAIMRRGSREYLIADAPGHMDFLRNMATGASGADAAVLVVDAVEGFRSNTLCHLQLISLLGIRQVILLTNKMDLASYRREVFDAICLRFAESAVELGLQTIAMIPVSAAGGDNIAEHSAAMGWYAGPDLLSALELISAERTNAATPFRMYIQDVYKFTEQNDQRRIIAGTVESGSISPGDVLMFHPSGKRGSIKTIEGGTSEIEVGSAVGFTLNESIFVERGELVCKAADAAPQSGTVIDVQLFWLDDKPLAEGETVGIQCGTKKVEARVERLDSVLNMTDGVSHTDRRNLSHAELGNCVLRLKQPISFDEAGSSGSSRFAVVRNYRISGGGTIIANHALTTRGLRDKISARHAKWEHSLIDAEQRGRRFGQQPGLVLITGPASSDRKQLAKVIEAKLFADGRAAYFLGFGNLLYGVGADLENGRRESSEPVRRLGEVANVLLDAGLLLIVSAAELSSADVDVLNAITDFKRTLVVWYGARGDGGVAADLVLENTSDLAASVLAVEQLLMKNKLIFAAN